MTLKPVRNRPFRLIAVSVLAAGAAAFLASCREKEPSGTWLDRIHEEGRAVFHKTIREDIAVHPKRASLTAAEIAKVEAAETLYPRLYEILINVFYQKDEPLFAELIRKDDDASRGRFEGMYRDLAGFSGHMFVEAFFATDPLNDKMRQTYEPYKGLDAVDLVIRSIGYNAKLDPAPPREKFANPLSPEFERQGAFDAAGFLEAHKITRGRGAKIAILDSGIDESHSVFKDTKWGKPFSLVGRVGKPWAAEASAVDWGWHGTLITSIAAWYAPEAEITVYKMLDGETQNDPVYQLLMESILAACIYRAVHDGNDIISISASGANLDLDYLREAVRYAVDRNRILVSGALYSKWFKMGNTRNFPSQYPDVVAVTAAAKKPDGTYGYWDVCAAQDANTIAAPNDIFGAFPVYAGEKDAYIPSISAAIPVVSALFALMVSVDPRRGDEPPAEYARTLIDLVKRNASPEKAGFEGFSPECGHGLIDAPKSVRAAAELAGRR